jgi:hypothetical protein
MSRGVLYHDGTKGVALVTRSGSHSLFKGLLRKYHSDLPQDEKNNPFVNTTDRWHPVMNLPNIIDMSHEPKEFLTKEFAVVVRNPVERFTSSCARLMKSPSEVLDNYMDNVHVWTLKSMGLLDASLAKYFLFETQLEACATYLGLDLPLPALNSESNKPELSHEELNRVQTHFAEDIALYERLKNEQKS